MSRYVRVEGFSAKEDTAAPSPPERLYESLFWELCQVDSKQITITHQHDDREGHVAEGFYGNQQAGIRWVEAYTGMTPMRVQHTSYGLPEMEINWRYNRHKQDYSGYVAYQHDRLEVTFEDDVALNRFVTIWRRVFGWQPILIDISQTPQTNGSQVVIQPIADNVVGAELKRLVGDPATSAPILHQIWQHLSAKNVLAFEIYTFIANHPNASPATLQGISDWLIGWYQHVHQRKEPERFNQAGDLQAALFAALDKRADDFPAIRASFEVLGSALPLFRMSRNEKYALASDPEASGDILLLLAQDASEEILGTVAKNPGTSPMILEMLIEYRSEYVEDMIARNPNASGELLSELYERQHSRYYRNRRYWLIAAHRNTPQNILTELASDTANIRDALKNNPNAPQKMDDGNSQ